MPTPVDEFPAIPEDDGSGGSCNESQGETISDTNNKQSDHHQNTQRKSSDQHSQPERKGSSKHAAAERKGSNKLQRQASLRKQASVEGRLVSRQRTFSRGSSVESDSSVQAASTHPRLGRRRSGSVRHDNNTDEAAARRQIDQGYIVKSDRTRETADSGGYLGGITADSMGFKTLLEEGSFVPRFIFPEETKANKKKINSDDISSFTKDSTSRDFWDAFEEDEVDDDVFAEHEIFWSPRDLIITSLQISAAALLLLTTLCTLAGIQLSLIVLTRSSNDSKALSLSQSVVLIASCIPVLISFPSLCIDAIRKKMRWPNFKQGLVAVLASLLDSYNLLLLCILLLPKLNLLESALVLAATSSTSQSLRLLISNCKEAGDSPTVFSETTLASIIQLSTGVCLFISCYYDQNIWAAVLIPMGLLTSIIYELLKTSSETHTLNSQRSKRGVQFISGIAKICFTAALGYSFIDTSALDIASVPNYIQIFGSLLMCLPFVYYLLLQTISYFKLNKGATSMLLFCLPLFLSIAVIVALVHSPEFCLMSRQDGDECETTLTVTKAISVNWPLLMVLAGWVWSYRVLTTASESRNDFSAMLFYKADNFAVGILSDESIVHKEKTHTLSVSNYLPLYKKVNAAGINSSPYSEAAEGEEVTPKVYLCATMWHENREEMTQLLTSALKLDEYQCMKKQTTELLSHTELDITDPEYFEFETHIMFDDAMAWGDAAGERNVNTFVSEFVEIVQEVAVNLHGFKCMVDPPLKYPTPYGGRLVFTLPGENNLVVHLKDKLKIRNKKRWSMIQYMYYLLGYKLLSEYPEDYNKLRYQKMPCKTRISADNTFVLTVDGDTDFEPQSIQKMLNQLRNNKEVGVVCGRIHPIGEGWLVWYQKFEYAIAHWLHKTAEHVMGVVLCTPGCFSMFRASALMDNNIIKTFTREVKCGRDALQYEQGEDRWLCSLIFQQGHRCEYTPDASAYTFAPETLNEFFNQRRRWALSTVVNHLDLLIKWRNSYLKNRDISLVYVFFEAMLFLTTILGPAYVLLVLAYANFLVFGMELHLSYAAAIAPPLIYSVMCCLTNMKVQVRIAQIMSIFYGCIMGSYLIWNLFVAVEYNKLSSLGILMFLLGCVFALTAILHPREITDILPLSLYYLLIPTTYMILMIYCVFNLDNVSWGTREVVDKKKKEGGDNGVVRDDLVNPSWAESKALDSFQMEYLDENEIIFWKRLIGRYLEPHAHTEETKEALKSDLKSLRTKSIVGYFLLNGFLLYTFYMMQKYSGSLHIGGDDSGDTVEPVALMCVVMFGLLVLAQFVCLIWQRLAQITKGCAARLKLRHSSVDEVHPDIYTAKQVVEHLKKLKLAGTGLKKVFSERSMNTDLTDKIENITDLLASESKQKRTSRPNNRHSNKKKHQTINDKLMDV